MHYIFVFDTVLTAANQFSVPSYRFIKNLLKSKHLFYNESSLTVHKLNID